MKMSDYFALPVLHDVYAQDEHAPVYAADCNRVVFKGWNEPALELACMAINNHDRLTEENAKLRHELANLIYMAENNTGNEPSLSCFHLAIDEAKQLLLNQLKDQGNDK